MQALHFFLQDAHRLAERTRRVRQLLGPEQHNKHNGDDQDFPGAVEKVAKHVRPSYAGKWSSPGSWSVCGAHPGGGAGGPGKPGAGTRSARPADVRCCSWSAAGVELAVDAAGVEPA